MTNPIEIEMTEEEYEELLNSIYEPVSVCGYMHDQGSLLLEIDPIAFRCGLSEEPSKYQCGECENIFDDYDDANECCQDVESEDEEE
jgi:hypothetical protein